MNPGIRTMSPRSVTGTPGAAACTSDTEPITVIRPVPVSIANARARGVESSMVMIADALRIRSVATSAGSTALPGRAARNIAQTGL